MITASDLAIAVGRAVLDVVVFGWAGTDVRDVFLASPEETETGHPGDLVLGLGVRTVEDATELIARCVATQASGLVLRAGLAQGAPAEAAERSGITLLALSQPVSWAHVVWLLRGVIDRAASNAYMHPSTLDLSPDTVRDELNALSDAIASLANGPVTIESNDTKILAYSSIPRFADLPEGIGDAALIQSIMERKVPKWAVEYFRSQAVYRKLAQSYTPFEVAAGRGISRRIVVPVHTVGQRLGSVWIVTGTPLTPDIQSELKDSAHQVGLHLLTLRAQSGSGRFSSRRLREMLRDGFPNSRTDLLPRDGAVRVIALENRAGGSATEQRAFWEPALERRGWAEPLITELENVVFTVMITEGNAPGSWTWLRRLIDSQSNEFAGTRALAGRRVIELDDLLSSRDEAAELLTLDRLGGLPGISATTSEEAWAQLIIYRASRTVDLTNLEGPLGAVLRYDVEHGTGYVDTLNAYFAHAGMVKGIARELHLTEPGVRYRMKQLQKIVQLDLTDPVVRIALQVQLQAVNTKGSDTDLERSPASGTE